MAKHTSRDAIWAAALAVARENATESSSWRRSFGADDVARRVDVDVSNRTVRDTLATMADLGVLATTYRQGEYEPTERMRDCAEALAAEQRDDGRETAASAAHTEPTTSTPETSSSAMDDGPTAADQARDVDADPDASDDDQDASADDLVSDLDLPGSGDMLERRRQAVAACIRYLQRDGSAQKSDFVDDVYPDHQAGYGSAGGWWNAVGKQGLSEVAERVDDLVAPSEGAHTWQYNGEGSD